MTVDSVLVNGRPATFTFVQPTYPGDPNGQNDPDPRAHEAGQNDPGRRTRRQPAAAGLLARAARPGRASRTRWTAPRARRTSS